MKTKNEIVADLKSQHPTLKTGSDETGYTDLLDDEYEATIEMWANDLYSQLVFEAKLEADKKAALAKLEALGLTGDDLIALGL
jgi:hypothetical protein